MSFLLRKEGTLYFSDRAKCSRETIARMEEKSQLGE